MFKNVWLISTLIRERYQKLRGLWEEIIRFHQSALTIAKASNTKEFNEDLDIAYTENRALANMERNLEHAICQENTKSVDWERDWKAEASFFQSLKSNPIWTQFHGYDPYFEPVLDKQG